MEIVEEVCKRKGTKFRKKWIEIWQIRRYFEEFILFDSEVWMIKIEQSFNVTK